VGFDLTQKVVGRVWKFGDSVESDAINPYYKYPKMEDLKLHTMEAYRPEFPKEVKPGDIIVAGRNFGCGSSRPGLVLREVGISVILAETVSRLFLRNSIARGIAIFMAPGISKAVDDGQELEVNYQSGEATNLTTGQRIMVRKFPPLIENIFAAGGLVEVARLRFAAEHSAAMIAAPGK
jgi:3-isopropylmalate/(R)-2-methylmalate dehydratase small subunit